MSDHQKESKIRKISELSEEASTSTDNRAKELLMKFYKLPVLNVENDYKNFTLLGQGSFGYKDNSRFLLNIFCFLADKINFYLQCGFWRYYKRQL